MPPPLTKIKKFGTSSIVHSIVPEEVPESVENPHLRNGSQRMDPQSCHNSDCDFERMNMQREKMSSDLHLTSKVLLFEKSDFHSKQLFNFFEREKTLIGIRAKTYKNLQVLLKKNIDLGAIFVGGNVGKGKRGGLSEIVHEIRHLRPELPIFIRSNGFDAAIEPEIANSEDFVQYEEDKPEKLKELIQKYIFNIDYPNGLVRGIQEISCDILNPLITNNESHYDLNCSIPFLIRDRYIEGTCMSLIQLTSNWCNGYMILELLNHDPQKVPQDHFMDFCGHSKIHGTNNMLSEITNLIWGGIKTRFFNESIISPPINTQVPIVINYQHDHISFGTDCPQLCYRYTIQDTRDNTEVLELSQKFIFHLNWSPEQFRFQAENLGKLTRAGDMELFDKTS